MARGAAGTGRAAGRVVTKPIRLIARVMSPDAFATSPDNDSNSTKTDVVLSGRNFFATKVRRTLAPRLK